jgi:hypothetical protein
LVLDISVFGFANLRSDMSAVVSTMRPETQVAIARDMLKMLYNKQKQMTSDKERGARDKDFKKILGSRNPIYFYAVRKTLMKKGTIIKRADRKYYLVEGSFRPLGEILKYLGFLRSHDPKLMSLAALNLQKIYSEDAISEAKDFEEFLQIIDLNTLLQSEDVTEITQIKEVWMLFIDVLDKIDEFSWISKQMADAIYGAVMRTQRYESMGFFETSANSKTLRKELCKSIQKAILRILRTEDMHSMYERVAIELLIILQELNGESEYLLNTIKEILRTPSPNRDRFSRLDQPASDDLYPSYETKFPELWHTTGDYSDLFKAIYIMLGNIGRERMRDLLLKWVDDEDVNLRLGASLFVEYELRHRARAKEPSQSELEELLKATIKDYFGEKSDSDTK